MQNDIVKPSQQEETKQQVVQDVVAPPSATQDAPAEPKPQQRLADDKPKIAPKDDSDEIRPEDTSQPQQPKAKSNTPKGVITAACIVCLSLVGLSVYMAMGESKNLESAKKPAASQQSAATAEQNVQPDVQGAIDEIDALPDAPEDESSELSDEALGL